MNRTTRRLRETRSLLSQARRTGDKQLENEMLSRLADQQSAIIRYDEEAPVRLTRFLAQLKRRLVEAREQENEPAIAALEIKIQRFEAKLNRAVEALGERHGKSSNQSRPSDRSRPATRE